MFFFAIFVSINLFISCLAVPVADALAQDNGFGLPSIPGFQLPGLSDGSDSRSSQVFHKIVSFRLSGKQYPNWPFASRQIDIALEYSYKQGSIEGVPVGTISATGKLLEISAKATSLITTVSWSGDKQSDNEIIGVLDLEFRLFDAQGLPTFSFEVLWDDKFVAGSEKGDPWQEGIVRMKRVTAQCEEDFCAKGRIVVLGSDQFSIFISPRGD